MRLECSLVKVLSFAVAGVALTLAGAIALSARASAPRDIRMVVRGMTFYLEGSTEPNPVVRVRRGEDVRLVIRNEDVGMMHDFSVPELGLASSVLNGRSETSVTFRAPAHAGAPTDAGTPHAAMMRGTIAVE
jgi:heme/copper-type cytochrome/quinol oxidase subunit 2